MSRTLEDRLKAVTCTLRSSGSCAAAVLDAYADCFEESRTEQNVSPGISGTRIGSGETMCAAIAAADLILRNQYSNNQNGSNARDNRAGSPEGKIAGIHKKIHREYGGVTCSDILQGGAYGCSSCEMLAKDIVLLLEYALEQ